MASLQENGISSTTEIRSIQKTFSPYLQGSGIESVQLPRLSPNLNAYAERFVRTIKEGCLEQMILFGEDSHRNAIRHFVAHYHLERNHQGLENRLIMRAETAVAKSGRCKPTTDSAEC